MKIWSLFLLGLFLTGCATIVNGLKQTVSLMSKPSGAVVMVGGEFTTRTPAALSLRRGRSYSLLFQKEGYKPQTLILQSSFSHWAQSLLGNIWNYILPGLIVDFISGGGYEFDQQLINCILVEDRPMGSDKPGKPGSPTNP